MTVICTETYLLTNPVYHPDHMTFEIALSSLAVHCSTHRQELIQYTQDHKILKGDLIRLYGIFMSDQTPHYINLNGLSLLPSLGKKRKIQLSPPQTHTVIENYLEMPGGFTEYFFMWYGKVMFLAQSVQSGEMTEAFELLSRLHGLYREIEVKGVSRWAVLAFVRVVRSLIECLFALEKSFGVVWPPGLVLDHRIYLPSLIYLHFVQLST